MIIFNKYYQKRILIKIKEKNFLGLFFSALNFFNKTLNPKYLGELPFKHFFLKKRKLIKKFTEKYLEQLDDMNIENIGNYLLKKDLINPNSIVYSFGIGENIGFEKRISQKFGCKVFCFDPTSLAKNYMKVVEYDKNKIIYNEYGIYKKDGLVKFFLQDANNSKNSGGSITNLFGNNKFDLLQCYTLSSLMKKNNHNDIDILKLDIEGAAMDVIDNIIEDKIFPRQIVVEFEYSETEAVNEDHFKIWSQRLKNIINNLKEKKYRCYNLPRFSHMPYSTIEILFIRQ